MKLGYYGHVHYHAVIRANCRSTISSTIRCSSRICVAIGVCKLSLNVRVASGLPLDVPEQGIRLVWLRLFIQ